MAAYLLRRLWQTIPTLAGVILLVFVLFKFFGGDPAEILAGQIAKPDQIAAIRQQLGLDQPWWTQLWIFVKQVLTFDWGRSWATNEAVSTLFASRMPATLTVMVPILLLDTVLAVPIALGVAYVRGSLTDRALMVATTVALSISFLVYVIVGQYVFGFQLGWFPVQGWSDSFATNLLQYSPLPVLLAVMVGIALAARPHAACLVPERREEVTTEGGLDIVRGYDAIAGATARLRAAGSRVSLFIDAEESQIEASHRVGAQVIELHTGAYCDAARAGEAVRAAAILERLRQGAALAAGFRMAAQDDMAGKLIVVIIPSFAERYVSTALFEGL